MAGSQAWVEGRDGDPGLSTALTARIACPLCRKVTEAAIPEGACQFFWDCPACGGVLRPKPGDCCVFCSYADRRCPSVLGEVTSQS